MKRAILLALLLASCSSDPRRLRKSDLNRWTLYYEGIYRTKHHAVYFVERGEEPKYPWCAWSLSFDGHPEIVYNLNCERGQVVATLPITERILARHEVLHEHLRHHQRMCNRDGDDRPVYMFVAGEPCIDRDEAEAEVNAIEAKNE